MSDVFTDEAVEKAAKAAVTLDEPRALLDRFATLVRESGTADEEVAARYIVGRLEALGIPVTLHEPDLYISVPERAEIAILGPNGSRSVRARPPAMARSTGDRAVEGEVCYVPSRYAAGTSSLFDVPDAARAGGASAAETEVSQAVGQSVSVRRGEVETIAYNRDKGIGVTVYMVVERVTKQEYGAYVREHVFKPLGMSSASLCYARMIAAERMSQKKK